MLQLAARLFVSSNYAGYWVFELTSAPASQLSSSRKFEPLTRLLRLAGALLQHGSGATV